MISEQKAIILFLFNLNGPVVVNNLPEKTTLAATCYTKMDLSKVIQILQEQCPMAETS